MACDYAALKNYMAQNSGLTDAALLQQINAATATTLHDVPTQDLVAYLGGKMQLTAFLAWRSPTTGDAADLAAQELQFALSNTQAVPAFHMSNPAVAASMESALTALVAAGGLTAQNQSDIVAMASTTVPLWQSWGWTIPINQNELDAARIQ